MNKVNLKKILIITGGNVSKLDAFKPAIDKLGLSATLSTFSDINYDNKNTPNFVLRVGNVDIRKYDLIYIRMVGKRLEDAALLASFAKKHGITVVDNLYETETVYPSSISKAIETKKLIEAGISMPTTYYGKLDWVMEMGKNHLKFPFCIKSTSGRKAREVWKIEDEVEYMLKMSELKYFEKNGMRFFAQKYIKASQRIRVMVIGGKAVAATTRPTKWRKQVSSSITQKNPDGIKGKLDPIPYEYKKIAEIAAKAVNLDICGVDILHEDDTDNIYVIEANAAPAWKLIEKDWKIDMEEEVLNWLLNIKNE